VDRDYAFSRVPSGKPDDRKINEIPFTQFTFLHRGADYFEQVRKPREEWKTKDDIAPQKAEFDLRCAGEDYETAARVLLDFDYLMLWGQYKTVIDMHKRLQGKLSDSLLRSTSSGNLGTAYRNIGEYQEAIKYYEHAQDRKRK
jgi:tetratricopeptide (TPR) repeat protein